MNTNKKLVTDELPESFDLKTADILLVHTKRSLWGWLIRRGTHCYWNHALMVCTVGNTGDGNHATLVVDPKTDGSVSKEYITRYLNNLNKYDVAVKRLEAGWFQRDQKSHQKNIRDHICRIAISEVSTQTGFKLKSLIDQIIRQVTVVYRFVKHKIKGSIDTLQLSWDIKPAQVKAFTCGGFVQWCYYKAMLQTSKKNKANRLMLRQVLFNPRAQKRTNPIELLTTTAADLANCDQLSWKYVIKDRVFSEISRKSDKELLPELAGQFNSQPILPR